MKFKIKVRDLESGFHVDVLAVGESKWSKKVTTLGWQGGDFEHDGKLYVVRGPYHGLDDFVVYEMVKQEAVVEATKEVPKK